MDASPRGSVGDEAAPWLRKEGRASVTDKWPIVQDLEARRKGHGGEEGLGAPGRGPGRRRRGVSIGAKTEETHGGVHIALLDDDPAQVADGAARTLHGGRLVLIQIEDQ